MSKYDALHRFLSSRTEQRVVVRFDDLHALLGDLPRSAREYREWWTNNAASQRHAASWLNAGRRATPYLAEEYVVFELASDLPVDLDLPRRATRLPGASAVDAAAAPLPASADAMALPHVVCGIGFRWSYAGQVEMRERLVFPALPTSSGVYAFLLVSADGAARAYVGQAANLRQRMSGYRNPSPDPKSGQQTNRRLNALMVEHLLGGGQIHMHTTTTVILNKDQMGLDDKSLRGVIESAATFDLARQGFPMLNR